MITVYKYPIIESVYQVIELPEGAEILHVANQHEQLCMWCKVDTSKKLVKREFAVYGTGKPLANMHLTYINTFMMLGGTFVYHLFEIDQTLQTNELQTTTTVG